MIAATYRYDYSEFMIEITEKSTNMHKLFSRYHIQTLRGRLKTY